MSVKIDFMMKNMIILSLFLYSFHAISADNIYGACGARPGALESFFTHAKKIREKCVNDVYEEEKKKTQKEIEDLNATNKLLDIELKKVAYKVDYALVRCHPDRGEAGNPAREKKCSEIAETKNSIIDRIHKLTGWDDRPAPKAEENVTAAKLAAPCPSQDELNKMQGVRYYNKALYQTWERCVTLAQ
jgi:hypothetical protein